MKKIILFFSIAILFMACQKDPVPPTPPPLPKTPCEVYGSGKFKNTLPGKTPTIYWPCMGTKELVDAISYNFPSLYILMAGCCGLQSGYQVAYNNYSWFAELESREDAIGYLIAKYASIDTINYDMTIYAIELRGYQFYTYNLEVFLAQEVYNKKADKKQQLALLTELFEKKRIRNGKKDWWPVEGPSFVMARTMFYHNYEPFIQEIAKGDLHLKYLLEEGFHIDPRYPEGKQIHTMIFSMAKEFQEQLKSEINKK